MYRLITPLVTLLAAASLFGADALAQDRPGDGPRRHGPPGAIDLLARMERKLDLSDEQSRELLEVLQETEAERAALHERAMEQLRPEICALQSETESRILAVLTDEQAATFRSLKDDRQQRSGERGGRRPLLPDCEDLG